MATTRANKQHWLSPAGRSLWSSPVAGLLLFLLMIGVPATLPPFAYEHLYTQAHNESEPEDTEADETATTVAPLVGVPRSRKTRAGSPPTPSNACSLLLNAGALPHSRLLISALPMGAFAKRNGVGTPLRC